MRNGVYRAWIKGPNGNATGIVVLKDGDIFAADPRFAFNGRYSEQAGRITATIAATRLYYDLPAGHLPDLDFFHLRLDGAAGREFAQTIGSIDEVPDFPLSFECAFLCEA
jgi:hypothetical protein